MTDAEQNETETAPIRTAQDVALEQLTARLDRLEQENRELRQANAGLYAAAQPQAVPEPEPEPIAAADPGKAVLDEFNRIMYGE